MFIQKHLGNDPRPPALTVYTKKTRTPTCLYVVLYMDVSENRGTPKWMVYNGNPY